MVYGDLAMGEPVTAARALGADELRAVAASLGGPSAAEPSPAAEVPPNSDAGGGVAAKWPHDGRSVGGGRARLGEELPIFCEGCGYALHGLPQQRCDRCAILHFACPECGHHQPINTLRPAAQRVLGRIRAFVLGLWVLFKLNFFGWLLFAWVGMGVEWSYRFHSVRDPTNPNNWRYQMTPREVNIEVLVAFGLFALAFGMFGRMFLLRFRRGWAVGGVLGALVLLASLLGTWLRVVDRGTRGFVAPLGWDFQVLLIGAALTVVFGAIIVWPVWLALAHLFLPSRTAAALLDWQRSISSGAPALARQQ